MTDDRDHLPADDAHERIARRGIRAAVVFGVAMATLEMGVLLALLYC